MDTVAVEANEDLDIRGMAYKLLSAAFVPHDGSRLPQLLSETLDRALDLASSAGDSPAKRSAHRLAERLSRMPRDETELRTGASVVFGTPSAYPPYEGEYGMGSVFMKAQTMADIAGFYRAFGLGLSPSFKDRPDHLAAELEFMHFLMMKEAHAIRRESEGLLSETRKAQARFLEDHLGSWGSSFFTAISAGGGNPFYAAVADFGREFMISELTRLGISIRKAEVKEPSREPDVPAGCPIGPSE